MATLAVLAGVALSAVAQSPAWAASSHTAYVTNSTSNTVSAIDTITNTVLGAPITVGSGPVGVAITPASRPSLTVTKTHTGRFTRGRDGRYTITVGNAAGAGSTDGTTVTVHDTFPAGLRADRIRGAGWTCARSTLTCTRSDVLPAGHTYPPITLAVDVSCTAHYQVTNTAAVTGGGDTTTHTTTDPTKINHHKHYRHDDHGDRCDRHGHR